MAEHWTAEIDIVDVPNHSCDFDQPSDIHKYCMQLQRSDHRHNSFDCAPFDSADN